jgi:hypothetical protein
MTFQTPLINCLKLFYSIRKSLSTAKPDGRFPNDAVLSSDSGDYRLECGDIGRSCDSHK